MRFVPARRLLATCCLAVGVAAFHWPAHAQLQLESREAIALQNQILELRRELQGLQGQPRGGVPTHLGPSGPPSGASSDLLAQLLARVGSLEEQVRQLRGRLDETQNQVQQMGATLAKRIDDLAFQTQNPGSGPAPGGTMGSGPTGTVPPPTVLAPPGAAPPAAVRRTPEIAMQEGNAALARRDYVAAEAAAREVLANRTSPRAYDAQFLLAEALAGERQFSQAAIAYDDAYNRSRKGSRAQDALVGLSNALAAINERKAACDTLVKLRGEFPSPRPDVRDAAAAVAQRAGCR